MPTTALDVLLLMKDSSRDANEVTVKINTIAKTLGKSRRTIHRVIAVLKAKDLLATIPSSGNFSTYRVNKDMSEYLTDKEKIIEIGKNAYRLQIDAFNTINAYSPQVLNVDGMLWQELVRQQLIIRENIATLKSMLTNWLQIKKGETK